MVGINYEFVVEVIRVIGNDGFSFGVIYCGRCFVVVIDGFLNVGY